MDQRKRKNEFCKSLDQIFTGRKRLNINTNTFNTDIPTINSTFTTDDIQGILN